MARHEVVHIHMVPGLGTRGVLLSTVPLAFRCLPIATASGITAVLQSLRSAIAIISWSEPGGSALVEVGETERVLTS